MTATHEWWVYLLRCADGTLYCGSTIMLDNRIKLHNAGKGAKYTKPASRRPVTLKGWMGPFPDRSTAQHIEAKIKRLPQDKKLRAFVGEVAPWINQSLPSGAPTVANQSPKEASAPPAKRTSKQSTS